MTALTKYARIEATGLWRPAPDAQRREVVVSIGDATLVITDTNDRPLAHWSLAAVHRGNPGNIPALYHPDGDTDETLELAASEAEMVEAIETLRRTIERARPRPGRLRSVGMLLSALAVASLAYFWLPGALQDHTLTVVPEVKRVQIGAALLRRIERVSGPRCTDPAGSAALALLSQRLDAGKLAILPDMGRASIHVPGHLILINRAVLEDFEEPDVAAGYIVTEMARRDAKDPLRHLLENTGIWENFRLVTTGDLSPSALDRYAQYLMTTPVGEPEIGIQTARFAKALLRSTPYARARDITGETTLQLIEGDPMNGKLTEPLMSDPNWLRLQNICGG